MHPDGDANCMALSSARWPNPALPNNNPFARFTPTLDFTDPAGQPVRHRRRDDRAGARSGRRTSSSTSRPRCRRRPRRRTRSGRRSPSTSRRSTARTRTSTTSTAATCARSSRRASSSGRYDFGAKRDLAQDVHDELDVERVDRPAGADPRGPVALRERRRAAAHDRLRPRADRSATRAGSTTRSGAVHDQLVRPDDAAGRRGRPRASAGRATTPGASRATAIPAAACASTPAAARTRCRSSSSSATAPARWTTRRS